MAASAAEVRAYRHGLYERGTLTGDDGEVPVLPHGLPKVDSDGIAALAAAEGARTTLEVGAGVGVGTLAMCEALLAAPGGGDHTVVDPYAFGGDAAVHARARGRRRRAWSPACASRRSWRCRGWWARGGGST